MDTVATSGSFSDDHPQSFAEHRDHPHHGWFRTYVWTHDHKMIGKQYLLASMAFGAVSGLLAMLVR